MGMKAFLVAALEGLARWPMALSGGGRESPAQPDERPATLVAPPGRPGPEAPNGSAAGSAYSNRPPAASRGFGPIENSRD